MKTLILIRHAHRDKVYGSSGDDGISEKGKKQAEKLRKYYLKREFDEKPEVFSSAKARCMETVEPIADEAGVEVHIDPLLMEQEESDKEFDTRIKAFYANWEKSSESLTIACSHGDWIPRFMQLFFRLPVDLKKGGWIEIEQDDEEVRLRTVLQEL